VTMEVIVKRVGQAPKLETVSNDLESLQSLVGGYIEVVGLSPEILMICNEEGKFNGSEANFPLGHDVIMGDVFFCSSNGEEFDSLSEESVKLILDRIFDGLAK
jgi:hypothetical protein